MKEANITLSPQELDLVVRADWIQAKNRIIEKVHALMVLIHQDLEARPSLRQAIPPAYLDQGPKISRGEQYQGLPYVMMDFPRHFSRESIFAFRTFFWWGNFFSLNLHLRGEALDKWKDPLKRHLPGNPDRRWLISTGNLEWMHDLRDPSYQPVERMDQESWDRLWNRATFLKISLMVPLLPWGNIRKEAGSFYDRILELAIGQVPNCSRSDETIP